MKLGAIFRRPPTPIRAIGARAALHRMEPEPADYLSILPADGNTLGNTDHGDCWPVARRWIIALRRAIVAGDMTRPDVTTCLTDYAALTGFDLSTGLSDDGTETDKGMADWVRRGVRINDQALDIVHWLTVDPTNDAHLALAIKHAGPLMGTWRLPMAMQDPAAWSQAPGTGPDWTTPWGEHETVLGATDGWALMTTRTWGMDLVVHPEVRRRFLVAVDVPLDLTAGGWLSTTGLTPAGLDREALVGDMVGVA